MPSILIMRPLRVAALLACLGCGALGSTAVAVQFHVSTQGTSSGNGSSSSPWDLQTALYHPSRLAAGDTLWIHGGTYNKAPYKSQLKGTRTRPIIVRAFMNERVLITTSAADDLLKVNSNYTWYWGLELSNTHNPPGPTEDSGSLILVPTDGVAVAGNKFINCVLHDAMVSGFGDWTDADNTEIYGCLIYFCGRKVNNDNYGYAVYSQNDGGYKVYRDNFMMHNFGGYQAHLYTESATVDSFWLARNVFTANVTPSSVMVSGNNGVSGIVLDSNYFYGPNFSDDLFRERKGLDYPVIRGNWFMRGRLDFRSSTVGRILAGNTIYGNQPIVTTSGAADQTWDTSGTAAAGNTWFMSAGTPPKPTTDRVFVNKNIYEPGRANIIIYNWSGKDSVRVDISSVVPVGAKFVVRDAQNFNGPSIMDALYKGGTIALPMKGLPIATPVSAPPLLGVPKHSGPEFGTFIILSEAALPAPPGIIVGELSLRQNYPNPFNGQTTIGYVLPEQGDVSVTVYDILGRQVKVLVNGFHAAGEYTAMFDAANLAGGVYIYSVRFGSQVQNRMMLLLK